MICSGVADGAAWLARFPKIRCTQSAGVDAGRVSVKSETNRPSSRKPAHT